MSRLDKYNIYMFLRSIKIRPAWAYRISEFLGR